MKSNQRIVPITMNGRLNIPADMRRALGINGSERIVLTLGEGEIRITTQAQAIRSVRSLAAEFKPDSGLVSDQLIGRRKNHE